MTRSASSSTRRSAKVRCAVYTRKSDGADPSATAKPDVRLIKLLIRARRFHAALIGSDGVPFAALAKLEGVSPSFFTRLVRLNYLSPDITQAILDGRQPRGLTVDKLLAHSRLPLAWHEAADRASALLEPIRTQSSTEIADPQGDRRRLRPAPPISRTASSSAAVLEYGSTETLPLLGAMLRGFARLCRPCRPA